MTPSHQSTAEPVQLNNCYAWPCGLITVWRLSNQRFEVTFVRPEYCTRSWIYDTESEADYKAQSIFLRRKQLSVDVEHLHCSGSPYEPLKYSQQAR